MGKVTVVGGKVGMEEPVAINPVFANNDWETIIEAVQKNKVPDTWVVGSQKTMTINGTDYLIDIIGKNHDTYTSGGTAPLTFQLHDCYGTTYGMNSTNTTSGGWANTVMRNTHLPAILAVMPTEVQAGIREVNKVSTSGGTSTSLVTRVDKLFLLAEIEVFGSLKYSASGQGSQYDYYKAGNSKEKKVNGTKDRWWLRSPATSYGSNYFCIVGDGVNYTTDYANTQGARNAHGVSFAFCF